MLYDEKSELDKHFDANWILTPIKYDGIDFDKPDSIDSWISVQLIPSTRIDDTFGKGAVKEDGVVRVFSYARSATMAYKLASEVCKFLDYETISNIIFTVGEGDGQGALNLDGFYEVSTVFPVFTIK